MSFVTILAFLSGLANPGTIALVHKIADAGGNAIAVWHAIHDHAGTDAINAALQKLLTDLEK